MLAAAVLPQVSFLFRDDTGLLNHRQLPETGCNRDRRQCDFARGGTSITVRLV
jgi:hypothetical protein